MREKAAAAGIIAAIAFAIAVVLYSPLPVSAPDAPTVRVAASRPLADVRASDVPVIPRRPISLRKTAAPVQVRAVLDREPPTLTAISWVTTTDLATAPLPHGAQSGPEERRLTVVAAGVAIGHSFAEAGRRIGSAFTRAF